jgi:hypothetical protein
MKGSLMETRVHEIADGAYRLSTAVDDVPPVGFTFNQFLIDGDEPLLFHTGPRKLFPLVSGAAERVMPLDRLRWIAFGHFEADECGAMNDWLAAAPKATVAATSLACELSVSDQAIRPPRPLRDDDVIEPAVETEEMFSYTAPTPLYGPTVRRLAEREPATLACMHGASYRGDGAAALRALADAYEERFVPSHGTGHRGG